MTEANKAYGGKMSSEGAFIGYSTIYGVDGEHRSPYMTRFWIGRLRLHVFHRGDADPDPHDHPWPFWTFPFTSYIEEVTDYAPMQQSPPEPPAMTLNLVRAFRWTYRPATHCHRVLCRNGDDPTKPNETRKIVTLVWRGRTERAWGFLKTRDGKWCWIGCKDYIFKGGKNAPCG